MTGPVCYFCQNPGILHALSRLRALYAIYLLFKKITLLMNQDVLCSFLHLSAHSVLVMKIIGPCEPAHLAHVHDFISMAAN